ncbi:TPA: DapH/DapD/GlmU-related protein [Streptococcus suis]
MSYSRLGFYSAKLRSKMFRKHEILVEFYRKGGAKIGKGCLICSPIMTREPFLISIGDNTTVSTNVKFVTHDNSVKLVHPEKTDLFGKIVIGNNCFIGENSTILYGVEIPDNTIIAAGSVVTKSILQQYMIVGGNPARIIGSWDAYREKYEHNAIQRCELQNKLKTEDTFLVKRPFMDEKKDS